MGKNKFGPEQITEVLGFGVRLLEAMEDPNRLGRLSGDARHAVDQAAVKVVHSLLEPQRRGAVSRLSNDGPRTAG